MRQFTKKSIIFLAPLMITFFGGAIYFYSYVKPNQHGDLEALGGIIIEGSEGYKERLEQSLQPERFAPKLFGDVTDAEIISLGDSFCLLSPNYVDFAVSCSDRLIYDLPQMGQEPFDLAIALLNRGYFAKFNTKMLLLESVERSIYPRLCSLKFNNTMIAPQVIEILEGRGEKPAQDMIKAAAEKRQSQTEIQPEKKSPKYSFAEVKNWMLLCLKERPMKSEKLSKPMFSIDPLSLYFYKNDVKHCSLSTEELSLAQLQLNNMYDLFKSHGIELVVLCAADKYSIYQELIVNNKYPYSNVAQQLETIPLKGKYISSYNVVKDLVNKNIQDVYFVDDSHWSPKGGKAFGQEVARQLLHL